ncbi:MinD/ParA family protein [uncultured Corynebacterium sp.]|uniref:MinD/ParA family ATP-binding protein n=1 Tax=uncultured Corynebacterium sp. TaxID=159447 RepID=UPI0025FFA52B|nr:MinD/ParA family protein [uncultured Corynebacterium sp.]
MSTNQPSHEGLPSWLQFTGDGAPAQPATPPQQPSQPQEPPAAESPTSSPSSNDGQQQVPAAPQQAHESKPQEGHQTNQVTTDSPEYPQPPQGTAPQGTAPQGSPASSEAPQQAQPQQTQPQQTQAQPQQAPLNHGKHHVPSEYDLKPPPALDQTNLVNAVKKAPRSGWRKMLYNVTGGHWNVGDSQQDLEHDQLLEKIRRPLRGDYRIAVMSLKGGVGKTTTTVALGGVFSSIRHDRVIAIDANPDLGTLAQRVAAPGPATIRDLLNAEDTSKYASIRQFTTQAKSRLEVIGSERDPAVSESFSDEDYRHAVDILQHHYNVMLTDCGTGLMHSAMSGVLELANSLVLVTSPALDGAQSASATLDWLNLHGYEQLAANSVVVVSAAHPENATIDMDQLIAHFRSRTRAVHVIPFDRHLSEGATVDLDRISKETKQAYMELAAIVAEDFDSWHRHAAS